MYESEANQITDGLSAIPLDILERFAETRGTVLERSLIPWGEHCTECVWPTCYSSCDLYEARSDGGCRRFVQGMVRLDCPGSVNGYLLRISFKRWAKLWSAANIQLHPLHEADKLERKDLGLAGIIHAIPIASLQGTASRKRYSWKKRLARRPTNAGTPGCLLIECFNPNRYSVPMTLTLRNEGARIPFQMLLQMQPQFNRYRVSCTDIAERVNLRSKFDIDLIPNEASEGMTLYFGALDFVVEAEASPHEEKPAKPQMKMRKCVVWDLDNTIWDGILVEDGVEGLRLKPHIVDVLQKLDERGILISAVSKNNYDDAMAALRRFAIADYFLRPELSWNPKSQGTREIAHQLNIGIDSLLFVDDSRFEREEVKNACPEIETVDALEYLSILDRPDCQAQVTEESKNRRQFYREEEVRDSAHQGFEGDYVSFLRSCQLRLTIRGMSLENLERVYELTQRTNQMNFSGNRYTREQIRELLSRQNVDCYVLDCEDRFGAYGTIGFCTVHRHEALMTDLMFSCRVQAKRVEHAFLTHILRKYREAGAHEFLVNYRKTAKNTSPGKVFDDFSFEHVEESEGVRRLVFRKGKEIPDDRIVVIHDCTFHVTEDAIV